MKKNKTDTLKGIVDFCVIFLGYFSFFMILYYVIFIAKGYYHSDCTDTIMWAQASYDAGALMNPDFAYAGLIPFGGQLLMLPFVALFGVGMKAQIIGMTIFCVLFVIAIIFLCRAMGFHYKGISVMVSSVLILISASEKLREIFWGHIIYYSLGIFFLMVGFALVLKCIKAGNVFFNDGMTDGNIAEIKKVRNDKEETHKDVCKITLKKLAGLYVLLFVWTALCSMNGVQSLTIYGIPVLGAVAVELFFDFSASFIDRKNLGKYIVMGVLMLGMVFGLVLGQIANGNIVAGYADAYSEFSTSSEWVGNFLDFFPNFFTLLGVKIKNNMLIYSLEGIFNLLRIICAVVLLAVPVTMAFLYRKFEEISYRLMILIHHLMTLLILLGWIFGKLSSANWRLSPIVVTSVILCVMFVRWIVRCAEYKRLAVFVAIPVMCMVLITTKDIFTLDKQSMENTELTNLAEYLKHNDLEYGYATFWQANIITLISDSEVKVRVIKAEDEGYVKRLYQTNRNWYEKADGYDRYFVILTNAEYTDYCFGNKNYEEPEEMLECGNYKILVYGHNLFE